MRTFSLRNNKRLQNLIAIIATFEDRGLECGVRDDGAGAFFVRGKRNLVADWERDCIDVGRASLREAWLMRQERCICCGIDPAKRPNPEGRVLIGAVYNEDRGQMAYRWAKVSSLLVTPFFCDDCYDNPQTWRDLAGEPKRASSAETESEELPVRSAKEETRQGRLILAD